MTTKADRTIPNLENATPGFLLDEIGKMRVEASRLKFLDGVYKQALEARITEDQLAGKTDITGEAYNGRYKTVSSTRINSDGARMYIEAVERLLNKHNPELLTQLELFKEGVFSTSSYKQLDATPK